MKKEDKMTKTSFGEYFDNQRDAIIKAMQDKNKQQNVEWMERYEKRKKIAKEMLLLKKMAPVGPKEKKLLKKMIEETWSDKRLDALHQVNMADTDVQI